MSSVGSAVLVGVGGDITVGVGGAVLVLDRTPNWEDLIGNDRRSPPPPKRYSSQTFKLVYFSAATNYRIAGNYRKECFKMPFRNSQSSSGPGATARADRRLKVPS